MGKIRKAFRTASILVIILGLLSLFIPVVGFFVGLPMLFIGVLIFSKTKEEKLNIEKNIEGSLPILKRLIGSKNYLALLIALSFAFFVFGPSPLRLLLAGFIILLFILHSIAKHQEFKQTGKKPKIHVSDKQRKMIIVSAAFFIIMGFFYLFFMSLLADQSWKEHILTERIGMLILTALYAFPGTLIVTFGFWAINYACRSKATSRFNVIEPGQAVISKEGIKHKTLKESSN